MLPGAGFHPTSQSAAASGLAAGLAAAILAQPSKAQQRQIPRPPLAFDIKAASAATPGQNALQAAIQAAMSKEESEK